VRSSIDAHIHVKSNIALSVMRQETREAISACELRYEVERSLDLHGGWMLESNTS
jgi:hypothetical protein